MLNWYRSWPSAGEWSKLEAAGHKFAYVVDDIPKLIMGGQDYNTLTDFQDWPTDLPGFCMLEWDVALDPIERIKFAGEALTRPYEILVANYRIEESCVNRLLDGTPIENMDCDEAEAGTSKATTCETFGVGCIYFPQKVLREFLARPVHEPGGFSDFTLSKWYLSNHGEARVTWKVHPQHLHRYELT